MKHRVFKHRGQVRRHVSHPTARNVADPRAISPQSLAPVACEADATVGFRQAWQRHSKRVKRGSHARSTLHCRFGRWSQDTNQLRLIKVGVAGFEPTASCTPTTPQSFAERRKSRPFQSFVNSTVWMVYCLFHVFASVSLPFSALAWQRCAMVQAVVIRGGFDVRIRAMVHEGGDPECPERAALGCPMSLRRSLLRMLTKASSLRSYQTPDRSRERQVHPASRA